MLRLTWKMAHWFGRSRGCIDNGRNGCEDTKKHRGTNTHYSNIVQLFNHKSSFTVENFTNVHRMETLAKTKIKSFGTFKKAKMYETGGIVVGFTLGLRYDPIASAKASG